MSIIEFLLLFSFDNYNIQYSTLNVETKFFSCVVKTCMCAIWNIIFYLLAG